MATKKDTTEVEGLTEETATEAVVEQDEQASIAAAGNLIVAKANLELAELGLPPVTLGVTANNADEYSTRGVPTEAAIARAKAIGEKALKKGG